MKFTLLRKRDFIILCLLYFVYMLNNLISKKYETLDSIGEYKRDTCLLAFHNEDVLHYDYIQFLVISPKIYVALYSLIILRRLFLKNTHSNFFMVLLLLILVLSNSSFPTLASELTEEEYLAPYRTMFEQYLEESGVDAQIGDIELFYEACKDFSLSEWENRLNEMFKEFKSISENDEPIVLQNDKDTQFEIYEEGFDGGVPGISSGSSYNSINRGVPGTSSTKSSGYIFLEALSEFEKNDVNIKPFSSVYNFYDTFTGSIPSGYRYKITVDGTVVYEGTSKVFNSVNWQAWNLSEENYFHVTNFKNTKISGNTASTDAVGYLKTAEGVILTVEITMSYKIYANDYNG